MTRKNKLFLYRSNDVNSVQNDACFTISERNSSKKDPNLYGAFHWHDYFEMEFFWDGEGEHILNGRTMPVGRGTIYLITPSDFHTLHRRENGKILRYFNINFNKHMLSQDFMNFIAEYNEPMTTVLDDCESDLIRKEFEELLREYQSDDPLKEFMLRAVFNKIFLVFWRALARNIPESISRYQKRDGNVRHIVSYLSTHFREQVSLKQIASDMHFTPNYIGELFKREMGISFTEYVQGLRLNYAKNLLVCSDLSISDISSQSGFRSVSYFIKTFRSVIDKTPLEYRISNRKIP